MLFPEKKIEPWHTLKRNIGGRDIYGQFIQQIVHWDLKCVNLEHNLGIDFLSSQANITLEWLRDDLFDDILTLVVVVRHQAITWTCVDQDFQRHMTLLNNELNYTIRLIDGDPCSIFRGPFYWCGSTLIPKWIINFTRYKMLHEIPYSFPHFNGAAVEFCEW